MKTAIALLAAALSVAALSTNASAQQRMASNLGTTFPSVVTEKDSNILQQAGASMNTGSRSSISVAPIPSPSPRVRVPAPDKHNATQTQAPFRTTAFPTEEWMPSAKPAVNTIVGGGKGNGIAPGGKGNGIVAGGKGSSSAVLVKTYCSGYCVYDDHGADTSFGTRSGGGFKLASNKAELGTGAIGVIHPSYMPNPDKLWGLDEDSLTEGSAGEIDILSNTSIVLGDEAIGIIHPDYVPIDPEVPGEAIGVIHPDYVPIDPEEVPGEAMAYRLIASLIGGGHSVTESGEFHVEPAGVQEEWYDTGPFKLGSVTEEENPNDSLRPEKELIWLMGFPGSGADDIMAVVERATGETGATNYGDSLAREDDPMMAGRCEAAPNYSLAGEEIPCYTEFMRVKGNIPTEGFDTTPPDTTPPSPAPAIAFGLIASLIEGEPDRPDPTSVVAPTGETQGSNVATAIEYDLIAALIGGTADPGGEGTYTTFTEDDAAKTFDYCVIYPERCTVSEIERPTFGPHILTFDD